MNFRERLKPAKKELFETKEVIDFSALFNEIIRIIATSRSLPQREKMRKNILSIFFLIH